MKTRINKTSVVIKIYRVGRFFYNHHLEGVARLFYALTYVLFNCIVPPSADIGEGCNIAHGVGLVIHHEAVIGQNTKIYQNVTIGGGPIKIGQGCLIGSGAVVMADIGDNVEIGANSVVTKSIPSNCTAVGSPARVIRKRDVGK